MMDEQYCDVCEKSFTSSQTFYSHLRGLMHLMNAKSDKPKAPRSIETSTVTPHVETSAVRSHVTSSVRKPVLDSKVSDTQTETRPAENCVETSARNSDSTKSARDKAEPSSAAAESVKSSSEPAKTIEASSGTSESVKASSEAAVTSKGSAETVDDDDNDDDKLFCEACDKMFDNFQAHFNHLRGLTHIMNIKQAEDGLPKKAPVPHVFTSIEVPVPDVTKKQDRLNRFITDIENPYQQLSLNSSDINDNGSFCYCKICDLSLLSQVCYQQHLAGKKHQKALSRAEKSQVNQGEVSGKKKSNKKSVDPLMSLISSTDGDSSNDIMNAIRQSVLPVIGIKEEKKGSGNTEYSCELCDVKLLFSSTLVSHLKGSHHIKNFIINKSETSQVISRLSDSAAIHHKNSSAPREFQPFIPKSPGKHDRIYSSSQTVKPSQTNLNLLRLSGTVPPQTSTSLAPPPVRPQPLVTSLQSCSGSSALCKRSVRCLYDSDLSTQPKRIALTNHTDPLNRYTHETSDFSSITSVTENRYMGLSPVPTRPMGLGPVPTRSMGMGPLPARPTGSNPASVHCSGLNALERSEDSVALNENNSSDATLAHRLCLYANDKRTDFNNGYRVNDTGYPDINRFNPVSPGEYSDVSRFCTASDSGYTGVNKQFYTEYRETNTLNADNDSDYPDVSKFSTTRDRGQGNRVIAEYSVSDRGQGNRVTAEYSVSDRGPCNRLTADNTAQYNVSRVVAEGYGGYHSTGINNSATVAEYSDLNQTYNHTSRLGTSSEMSYLNNSSKSVNSCSTAFNSSVSDYSTASYSHNTTASNQNRVNNTSVSSTNTTMSIINPRTELSAVNSSVSIISGRVSAETVQPSQPNTTSQKFADAIKNFRLKKAQKQS